MKYKYKNIIFRGNDEQIKPHPDYLKYFKTNSDNLRCSNEYWYQILEDIRLNGLMVPIIVNEYTGFILDGVIRRKAARRLGIENIHCLVYQIKSLEEEIRMLLRLQHFNKIIDNHEWKNAMELYYDD